MALQPAAESADDCKCGCAASSSPRNACVVPVCVKNEAKIESETVQCPVLYLNVLRCRGINDDQRRMKNESFFYCCVKRKLCDMTC